MKVNTIEKLRSDGDVINIQNTTIYKFFLICKV